MTTTHHQRTALLLHSLHRPGSPLVLPNAWDVASARIVADCGAAAVATRGHGQPGRQTQDEEALRRRLSDVADGDLQGPRRVP
ncbi:hypothetical protein F6X68_28760, partial [Micromonospora sp. AMSO12t]|uniref:isocitrate lyase/phosphoenolpyruvate mutase family protein n=1 Tax=Micromonospora sp. AMSO12t TaxID=2650410 RepID=UPI00139ECC06